MHPSKKKSGNRHVHGHGADGDDLVARNVTGKELSKAEELSARLTTLIEMLDTNGIINKSEYNRTVAMRLHEISKANAFEELDEEL